MEETRVNQALKEALDTQVNEASTNIKTLIEDAKEQLEDNSQSIKQDIKAALDNQMSDFTTNIKALLKDVKTQIKNQMTTTDTPKSPSTQNKNSQTPNSNHTTPTVTTYTSALINPLPHANPKLAVREGIKACQFAITGINDTAISHLNNLQLKELLNNTITDIRMKTGKICSVTCI